MIVCIFILVLFYCFCPYLKNRKTYFSPFISFSRGCNCTILSIVVNTLILLHKFHNCDMMDRIKRGAKRRRVTQSNDDDYLPPPKPLLPRLSLSKASATTSQAKAKMATSTKPSAIPIWAQLNCCKEYAFYFNLYILVFPY